MRRVIAIATLSALAACTQALAQSQPAWPQRPVRLVVPFPPGGSADSIARLVAKGLSERWGQQFVVDNRAGAAGNIGVDIVAKAAPDGYTLVLATSGPLANNKYLYKSMPFDTAKDLTPVILVGDTPLIVVAHPSVPAQNLREFVELARTGGAPTIGTPGTGSIGQLGIELIRMRVKFDYVHVPYKGDTPALADLVGGSIRAVSAPITAFVPHVQAGKIRGLAVLAKSRYPGLPDLQTAAELGIDAEAAVWYAMMAPAGTPKPIVERLNQEVNRLIEVPAARAQLAQFGTVVAGGEPGRLSSLMAADSAKWKQVIETAKLKLE